MSTLPLRVDSDDVVRGRRRTATGWEREPLGVVEAGDERDGLAVLDPDDAAVAGLVELADDGDVDLAVRPDGDGLGILQPGDDRLRRGGGPGEPGV